VWLVAQSIMWIRRLECGGQAVARIGRFFLNHLEHILENHIERLEGIAEILLAHIFCGVTKALLFLQSCDPPIVHRDNHPGNIMLELSDGLPRAVLNDFDCAEIGLGLWSEKLPDYFLSLHVTIWQMHMDGRVAGIMGDHSDCTPLKGWDELRDALRLVHCPTPFDPMPAQACYWPRPLAVEFLTESVEPLAQSALESLTAQNLARVAICLRQAAEPQETQLLANFQRIGLLQGKKGTKSVWLPLWHQPYGHGRFSSYCTIVGIVSRSV
jgi:hypothetical protein